MDSRLLASLAFGNVCLKVRVGFQGQWISAIFSNGMVVE